MEKITVYGLPLNPMPALEQLKGASFCVSYATRGKLGKQLDQAIRLVGDDALLLVDNGAFSHWQGGGQMTDDYIEGFEDWAADILARAGRVAFNWLPIFELSTAEVFASIAAAGQQPHPAYAAGNERLSCVFCFMGSRNDLALGAAARPELFARYVELEERTGYTMHISRKSLPQLVAEAEVRRAA